MVPEGEPCYYCGQPATDLEHVIPKSVLGTLRGLENRELNNILTKRILTVYSCRECNSLLGPTIQSSLVERKRYLKDRLKKRYKKALAMPDWTDKELEEIGDHLKDIIQEGIRLRNRLRSRLAW